MIGLSDVQRYVSQKPAVVRFKPWWELFLDLLTIGMFIMALFAWGKSFNVESGGIICIPLVGDVSNYPTSTSRYVQSRCFVESSMRGTQYYPYLFLMQWFLVFLCQISWLYIPTVNSKLEYFYEIFREILSVNPIFIFDPNNCRMLPEIDYNEEDKKILRLIHDRITFILIDKNHLARLYRKKTYIFTIIITCCILSLCFWMWMIKFAEGNFVCLLKAGPAKKDFPLNVCNMSPALYIYGVMVFHLVILVMMLCFSTYSIVWQHGIYKKVKENTEKLFGEYSDSYQGLPGFEDLVLVLELARLNFHDGEFSLNVLMYVLTSKYDSDRCKFVRNDGVMGFGDEIKVKFSFWEEYCLVNYMLSEIGLKIINFLQTPNGLFSTLGRMFRGPRGEDYVIQDVRQKIYEGIIERWEYYKGIVEADSNFPPIGISTVESKNRYSIFEKLKKIKNEEEWPDHFIIMVLSDIFCVKFILISADSPLSNDVFSMDVFYPADRKSVCKTIILAFINPHYYYFTEEDSKATTVEILKRKDFLENRLSRNKMRRKFFQKVGYVDRSKQFMIHG